MVLELKEIWTKLNLIGAEYAWITQVFIVVFVSLLIAAAQKTIFNRLHQRLLKTATFWDDALVDALRRPATVFIWIVGIAFAARIMGFLPSKGG